MVAPFRPIPVLCSRCRGRMFLNDLTGDRTCFSCGNVLYTTAPTTSTPDDELHPHHGGKSLN